MKKYRQNTKTQRAKKILTYENEMLYSASKTITRIQIMADLIQKFYRECCKIADNPKTSTKEATAQLQALETKYNTASLSWEQGEELGNYAFSFRDDVREMQEEGKEYSPEKRRYTEILDESDNQFDKKNLDGFWNPDNIEGGLS